MSKQLWNKKGAANRIKAKTAVSRRGTAEQTFIVFPVIFRLGLCYTKDLENSEDFTIKKVYGVI